MKKITKEEKEKLFNWEVTNEQFPVKQVFFDRGRLDFYVCGDKVFPIIATQEITFPLMDDDGDNIVFDSLKDVQENEEFLVKHVQMLLCPVVGEEEYKDHLICITQELGCDTYCCEISWMGGKRDLSGPLYDFHRFESEEEAMSTAHALIDNKISHEEEHHHQHTLISKKSSDFN